MSNKRKEENRGEEIVIADGDAEPDTPELDIVDTIDKHFGDVHNVLQYCGGSGCYVLMGPTDSGKTSAISALCREAQEWSLNNIIKEPPVIASSFAIISKTNEITNDLFWCKDRSVTYPMTEEAIRILVEQRGLEIKRASNGTDEDGRRWANKHPLFIFMDDFYGIINTSKPGNSVSELATMARNFGIYLIVLAQGFNQCSPVIKQNARALITFGLNSNNHLELYRSIWGKPSKQVLESIVTHSSKLHKPVVYVRTWELSKPEFGGIRPRPLLIGKFTPIQRPQKKGERKRAREESESDESDDEELEVYDEESDKENEWPHLKKQKTDEG